MGSRQSSVSQDGDILEACQRLKCESNIIPHETQQQAEPQEGTEHPMPNLPDWGTPVLLDENPRGPGFPSIDHSEEEHPTS